MDFGVLSKAFLKEDYYSYTSFFKKTFQVELNLTKRQITSIQSTCLLISKFSVLIKNNLFKNQLINSKKYFQTKNVSKMC